MMRESNGTRLRIPCVALLPYLIPTVRVLIENVTLQLLVCLVLC